MSTLDCANNSNGEVPMSNRFPQRDEKTVLVQKGDNGNCLEYFFSKRIIGNKMFLFSWKLSKNYALEISGCHRIRDLKDGLDLTEFHVVWDRYKADHNPRFHVILVILNFVIFEFEIYNVNHCED